MRDDLQTKLKEYLKSKDRVRADTVRSIIAAIQYEEMSQKVDSLDKDSCIAVLQRELKKRKEELEFLTQADKSDSVEKNRIETEVIESFLPQRMNVEQLTELILKFKEDLQAKNMGPVMKALQEGYAGQYDGKTASEIAKKLFA
jgi:uncharacterized protein YqeY